MKDLTHYFQSPNKVTPSTVSSSENCIVLEKFQRDPNSCSNTTDSQCFEKVGEGNGTSNLPNDKAISYSSPTIKCKTTDGASNSWNEHKSLKISRKTVVPVNGNIKRRYHNQVNDQISESSQKVHNMKSDGVEQYRVNEPELSPVDTQVSPNAFQVLMSTQQVFSSSNSGHKECINETVENDPVKTANRKKIKDNLEKMSKRKLEMETNVRSCETLIEKPMKKRKRIIMESDSENESDLMKSLPTTSSDEKVSKYSRKRIKPELQVEIKRKKTKCEKLCDEGKPKSEHLDPKERSSRFVALECQNQAKCKSEISAKSFFEQSDKAEEASISEKSKNCSSYIEDEISVKESLPKLEQKVCNNSNISGLIEGSNDENFLAKKKSNILNYFNKVNNGDKRRHSEKIKVTVDVHFPVVSTHKSKKAVLKKKYKRKGQSEMEDDIQLIDTEVIEKTDPPVIEMDIAPISSAELRSQNCDPSAKTVNVPNTSINMKTNLNSPDNSTPSRKDWKLRIRMPERSLDIGPSPVKPNNKTESPLKKPKLKLTSDKHQEDNSKKKFDKPNIIISHNRTPKKKIKKAIKKSISMKEISSSITEKKVGNKSTPKKRVVVNDETQCDTENEIEYFIKKPTGKKERSVSPKELSQELNNTIPGQEVFPEVSEIVLQKSQSNKVKDANFVLECTTSCKKRVSPRKHNLIGDVSSCEEAVASATKRKSISEEKTPGKKPFVKKKSSPVTNKCPPLVFRKKRNSSLARDKEKYRDDKEEEIIDASIMRRSAVDKSFEREEISTTGRIKRKCTLRNSDSGIIKKPLNLRENVIKKGKRNVSTKRKSLNTPEMSMMSKKFNSCGSKSYITRKKSVLPDVNIDVGSSDEDSCDLESENDFSIDSDDFIGDTDHFNDSENELDDDSENDDSIFEVKKNVSARKEMSLDQVVVLQFLKKAKGTLNRKMALNDLAELPCNQSSEIEKKSAPIKLAPVFISKKGKKTDRATLLARKTFLQSGVPEVVKKMVEIQKLAEEQEYVVFPSISHVQQKESSAEVWNLSDALKKFPPVEASFLCSSPLKMTVGYFTKCKPEDSRPEIYDASCPPKIKLYREYLRAIKAESPEFPVYRNFRQLFEQSHPQQISSMKVGSGKRGKRKRSLSNKNIKKDSGDLGPEHRCAAWTAKYRPLTSNSILGNANNVKRFKKWLELWVQVNENTFQKKIKDDVSSADEFLNDASDDESGRTILPKKSAVLMGPNGCGKTMTVYTLAHELGYKVLEVNAAAKRTGRRILSELLEATQSHQVGGKGDEKNTPGMKNFLIRKGKPIKTDTPQKENDQQKSKLSLILIEDVDIVFEDEDEGFVSALSSLVIGSKRPVVLVSSDPSCTHLSRFLEQSLVLEFKPAPEKFISVWFQLISLLEGVRVRRSCVEDLLLYNRGDVRKTLLDLQFWVLSGGSNSRSSEMSSESAEIQDFPDDASNSSWVSVDDKKAENETNHPLHSNCLSTFLILDPLTSPFNRSKIWWNLPKLIGMNNVCCGGVGNKDNRENHTNVADNISSGLENKSNENEGTIISGREVTTNKWKSVCSIKDIMALVHLSDALSVVDNFSSITDCVENEPDQSPWEKDPIASLSLSQDDRPCEYGIKETSQSIRNWLVTAGISQCSAQLCPEKKLSLVSDLQKQPPKKEISWRLEQHNVSRQLVNAVAMLNWPQRRAVATDYISSLRSISRLEQDRVCVNDKRNNRFFHYLKGLGIHTTPEVLDIACNVFRYHSECL